MGKRIFGSFIISLFLLPVCVSAQAQNTKPKVVPEEVPLYNGVYIGAEIYGIGSSVLGGDFLSSEVSVEVNLKRRFFPVAEIGYGSTDALGEKGILYKSSAPYFRIGMNYNVNYKKNNESHFYVGLRYGRSSFSYDVKQVPVNDPIWKESVGNNPELHDDIWGESLPYDHSNLKGSMSWYELVFGVRAQVYKNFMMGGSIRMKRRLFSSTSEYGDPWYVPGFGTYDSSKIGISYSLIYKLPF